MVAKDFAAFMAKIPSCFIFTTYVSTISSNIVLISKAIELTVFLRAGNVKKSWFWTYFPREIISND